MQLIGVDVGGTFTDLIYTDTESGRTEVHKVATTPDDPSLGIRDGVHALCDRFSIAPSSVEHLFHGTTIATNAILQHDGAVTGMVTTKNYRDILHIGRHQRPQHYSIRQDIPWQDRALVRRRYRLGVTERLVPPSGEVLVALDENEVRQAAQTLREAEVEAVTVCFLFSYLNPSHELRAAEILREELPDCFVTCSAQVSPQFREFERFTTAAMNAFIGPKVRRYVARLADELEGEGLTADLHIMSSSGGVATAKMVSDRPVMTLLSGPAAGVLGGAWTGELADRARLITFDMGGTSADIGIVTDGQFAQATARDTWIAGYPVLSSMIDIHTIGAGGGSIAHVDSGGGFRVGPRSAGAQPGPAAYGRGGNDPTVTDANVVLGRLHKGYFLGGDMTLDAAAAQRVIASLAKAIQLSDVQAADGVLTLVTSNMANAIRSRTVQKGIDPRDYSLVAFGGAGPLHAVDVAIELGAKEVIIPPHPGITSATGLLTTDLKYDTIRTEFQTSDAIDLARLNDDFAVMEVELHDQFASDGISADGIHFVRGGDLRYVGQGYELRVAIPGGALSLDSMASMFEQFHSQHEAEYGHAFTDSVIEIVNIRVTGIGDMPKIGRPTVRAGESLADARVDVGPCHFRQGGELTSFDTPFYERDRLPLDTPIEGPAIIVQRDSTTVIPPQCTAVAHAAGHLLIQVGGLS
ncbi:MAG: hydantoinase/oxoprolinase family protein [Chromatiales bacterium]|jgi:N-methylhydantoinase A|nr:hydantoinase/oxoprolinase family protein [Chromatiales bacterium]